MIPSQPNFVLPRPFANDGQRRIIPEDSGGTGTASLKQGFPPETQLPLNQGGVPPQRLDFNGILYMLSCFAFWQQSGGLMSYNPTLNYAKPGLVYHGGLLYWCEKSNGPDSDDGPVEPGTNPEFWLLFRDYLLTGGSSSGYGAVPPGLIGIYRGSGANIPSGWALCNGLNGIPDLRDKFVIGAGGAYSVDDQGGSSRHHSPNSGPQRSPRRGLCLQRPNRHQVDLRCRRVRLGRLRCGRAGSDGAAE